MSSTMRCLKVAISLLAATACAYAQAQTEFEPPSGKGRVVVAVSGSLGAGAYQLAARKLAQFGYDVFLVDGNTMIGDEGAGAQGDDREGAAIRACTTRKGGRGRDFRSAAVSSLNQATRWPDLVAVVVVMYPMTTTDQES